MENFIDPIWMRVGLMTAVAIVICLAFAVCVRGWDIITSRFRRYRGVVAVIFVGFAIIAGGKHGAPTPKAEWPNGVSNNQSEFDTNTWQSVTFKWSLSSGFPGNATMFFSYRTLNSQDPWLQFQATATASELQKTVSTASLIPSTATNWEYKVTTDYVAGVVHITDFEAYACTTSRFVTCQWSCPTNIVGHTAYVQYRMKNTLQEGQWALAKTTMLATNNVVNVPGNFISNGLDREFRVYVPASFQSLSVFSPDGKMMSSEAEGSTVIRMIDMTNEDLKNFRDGILLRKSILEVIP